MADFIKTALSALGINIGNLSEYPISGNNYTVVIGKSILGFTKISGITLKSTEVMALNAGGQNKPYMLPKENKDVKTITFEKGYGTADILSLADTLSMMMIIVRGPKREIKAVYYTDRMIVKDITLSELNASRSDVLIQSMTVAYNTLNKTNILSSLGSFVNVGSILDSLTGNDSYEDNQNKIKAETERLKKLKEEQKLKKEQEKKAAEEKVQKNLQAKNNTYDSGIKNAINHNEDVAKQREVSEAELSQKLAEQQELESKIEL